MVISRDDVARGVVEILRKLAPIPVSKPLNEETDPIVGLGLESEDGLDFACEISERFGFHFPDDKNPFVDDAGHRSRRVGEIIDLISPMLPR